MLPDSKAKPVVLVTAIGTATSTTIVTELRKDGGYYVIGTDIFASNEVATSLDVDEFHTAPSSVDDESFFLEYVLDLCRQRHVDYYFAIIDEEVQNIASHKHRFDELGVKLCVPNLSAVEICHDKVRFSNWCEKNYPQIAIRRIGDLAEAQHADYPLFLKPAVGRASSGCEVVHSYDALLELIDGSVFEEDIVLQELVTGDVVTVDVVRNAVTGQCCAIPRLELLRNGNGCGTAVEVLDEPDLSRLCREMAEDLDINGVVNMEFFRTPEGYKIIEINPRFSAGAIFSCMAGADLVHDALRIADGQPISENEIRFNTHFAKRYEAYELD